MLFDIKEVNERFYQERMRDFLPDRIIDIHTHVWLESMISRCKDESSLAAAWPLKVAMNNSVEDLIETYKLLFPGKAVMPLIFTHIIDKNNLDELNNYTTQNAQKYKFPSLAVTRPDWDSEKFERTILEGRFLGAKPYMTFAPENIPQADICIFDFLPHHQLEILNKLGLIVMLHIPRDQRLKDPVNLAQMLEIEKKYPNVKLIIAHVGRAYCPQDIGSAFEVLAETESMMFDFAANTNAEVFEGLIKAVGPERIMFGSDMPITRMRMRRICENGNYVNIVPKGLYGDVSDDKNMREVEGKEADRLSLFIYEQIDAFRQAAETAKLTTADIEDIFCNNASRLIASAKAGS